MRWPLLIAALLAMTALLAGCDLGGRSDTRLTAEFANTNNLFEGSEVRVLGLKVGEVTAIRPRGETVEVHMAVDGNRPIPADAEAELIPSALLGERFVQLGPPYEDGPQLEDGATIPLERTTQPAEVDEVLASFERFLSSLDGDALANLVDAMAGTVSGQGEDLNELIDDGTETVRVLADAGGDLNAVIAEFADLNETLATRDERIGSTLEEFSTTLQILIEERDEIIGTVAELNRLTAELQPLLDEHSDPLVEDLEQLTTTLSTVERNLENVGKLIDGSEQLFHGIGRAVKFDHSWLDLHNETEDISGLLVERIVQRLVGVCLRLEVPECADAEFFADVVNEHTDERDQLVSELGEVIAALISELPEEAQEGLGEAPGVPEEEHESDADDEPGDSGDDPDDAPEQPDLDEDDPTELLDDLVGGRR